MVRRFVEEAQIGGQLQHPAIVPVYEIGRLQDGRLFIAMKLVEGRTLAAFLGARKHPTDDRARLLSVFEQVCQAMAYAHSRGVVHRDLKPANVMMGSFGEVQVMDWGLAKVLDDGDCARAEHTHEHEGGALAIRTLRFAAGASESRAGSVLGTPAYMAPEQARGALETLDERADVFGLGAILCEILTGSPPYTGQTEAEAYRQAERALLGDAFRRLDECGADVELIALAKSCLAAAPKDRPSDAGAVLEQLTAYLAGVEERLHAAKLARAQAEARAALERKHRVLSVALAASVLAVALVSGSAWAWMTKDRDIRRAETARAVTLALDESVKKAALAQAAPSGDPARWIEAIEAVRRAEAVMVQGMGSAELAAQIQRVAAFVSRERDLSEAVGKDRRMVERLVEIHDDLGVHGQSTRADAEWAAAFRAYGVDVDALDPGVAAARLAASPVAAELAGALDQWIFVRRGQRPPDFAGARRLLAIAKAADPDPWRNRLRDTLNDPAKDRGRTKIALEQLAASADADSLPEASVTRLAFALAHLGDRELAISLLLRTQRAHPNDFWVNADLARELSHAGRLDEAVRFFSVAVAIRPRSEKALSDLAGALARSGLLDEAAATFRRLIRMRDDNAWAHASLGAVLRDLGQHAAAASEFEAATELQPRDAFVRIAIADSMVDQGEWTAAIAELRAAVRADSKNPFAHDKLGLTLLEAGRVDEAIAVFRAAAPPGRRLGPAGTIISLGRALLAKGELTEAVDLLRQPEARGPSPFGRLFSAESILREAERTVELDARLAPILAGTDRPANAAEAAEFARLCAVRQFYAASTRLWEAAFAANPSSRAAGRRDAEHFDAASSATRAGYGLGADAKATGAAARDQFRQKALEWLNGDLAVYATMLGSSNPQDRARARRQLGRWQVSPALAGIRDQEFLSDLPESERQSLQTFWSRVETLRTQIWTRDGDAGVTPRS